MPKIKYGLSKVHYSVVTETTVGGVTTSTYGPVKAWPGAVNISLDAQGDDSNFYADNGIYYNIGNNQGYQGDLETALVPEDVEIAVMGQTKDANGVVTETSDDVKKYIAIMFQFELDASGRRFVLYRCSLSRHAVSSSTKAETVDPQTDSVTITATPRPDDNKVKAYADKDSAAYANWFNAVYVASPVPAVEINTHYIALTAGETAQLTATTVPAGATVTWSSSSTSVVSVDDGELTAEGAGNAIVTASITDGGVSYTDTCTVVVTA